MGWIALDREIMNNELWRDKPFSKGQAWIDLLLLANWKDKKSMYKGELIICKRGDVNLSLLELSKRWGWSRQKTRTFITFLEKQKNITTNITTNRTTLTIENYEKYQSVATTNKTTSDTSDGTTNEQREDITKQYNKGNTFNNHHYKGRPQLMSWDEINENLKDDPDYQEWLKENKRAGI